MPKKKELTKQPKVYYNSSKTYRHCGQNIAFKSDGCIYVHCRKCKQWVKINISEA